MSLEEMLIAIAVGSANDACVAVAEHLEGSHEAFVERMNQTAQEMGLKNTHFVNSYGLSAEGFYTSSYDMAVIARHALQYPKILEYCAIKEYDLRNGEFKLWNTNKLLWWFPRGTNGFKTGWTNEAKYCLAATVKRDGLRLDRSSDGFTGAARPTSATAWCCSTTVLPNMHIRASLKRAMFVERSKVGKGVVDSIGGSGCC